MYGSNSSWYVDEEQTEDLKMIIGNLNIHVKSIKELLSVEREKVYTKQVYNNGDFWWTNFRLHDNRLLYKNH